LIFLRREAVSYGLRRKDPSRHLLLVMVLLSALAGILGGVLVGLATNHSPAPAQAGALLTLF
jgi:hypothetical protein